QHAFVRVRARVVWQQGGVDVEQPAAVVLHEATAENTHEAGQHYQVGCEGVDFLHQMLVEGFAIGEVPVTEHASGNAGAGRALKAEGIGPVADHATDPIAAACAGIDKCLQVAAVARTQHDYRACGHRGSPCRTTGAASLASRMLPISKAPRLKPCRMERASLACSAGTQTIMPTPQLKVRSVSASAILPCCCSHLKMAGRSHASRLMTAWVPSGRTRGRFSTIPPPVM